MQNNDPKSEIPAMKQRAAKDRDDKGRHQKDTRPPGGASRGGKHDDFPKPQGNTRPGNSDGK
jgi:hypothetical protein